MKLSGRAWASIYCWDLLWDVFLGRLFRGKKLASANHPQKPHDREHIHGSMSVTICSIIRGMTTIESFREELEPCCFGFHTHVVLNAELRRRWLGPSEAVKAGIPKSIELNFETLGASALPPPSFGKQSKPKAQDSSRNWMVRLRLMT